MNSLKTMTVTGFALCAALGVPYALSAKGEGKDKAPRPVQVAKQADGERFCPPGLATKSPACTPPGIAGKDKIKTTEPDDRPDPFDPGAETDLRVGQSISELEYELVRSWEYGLEPAPSGSRYAVQDGVLLRVDADTLEILNLIRLVSDAVEVVE